MSKKLRKNNNFLIAIPVINELDNLKILIPKILKIDNKINILIIDDNSKDFTKEWIIKNKYYKKKIFYIYRKKKMGIGSAHLKSIFWAFKNKINNLLIIDGDQSHQPKDIAKFFIQSKKNYDLIFSNRYSGKNNELKNWPFIKLFINKISKTFVKFFFKYSYDFTNGMRYYNLSIIKKQDFQEYIKYRNYEFIFIIGISLIKKYNNIKEINISMPYRKKGSSKMNINHMMIWLVSLIQYKLKC